MNIQKGCPWSFLLLFANVDGETDVEDTNMEQVTSPGTASVTTQKIPTSKQQHVYSEGDQAL